MPWLDYIWNVWIGVIPLTAVWPVRSRAQMWKAAFRQLSLLRSFICAEQSQRAREERPEDEVLHPHLHLGRKIRCPMPLSEGRRKEIAVVMHSKCSSAQKCIIYSYPTDPGRENSWFFVFYQSHKCFLKVPVVNLQQQTCTPKLSPQVNYR